MKNMNISMNQKKPVEKKAENNTRNIFARTAYGGAKILGGIAIAAGLGYGILTSTGCTENNVVNNYYNVQQDTCKINLNGLKEIKREILNIGGVIDAGTFKVRLADISVATGSKNTHPAILDIMDVNDAVIGQIQVNPCDMYTFTQSSTGNQIKVAVFQTAPGLTLSAKWAEIGVYN